MYDNKAVVDFEKGMLLSPHIPDLVKTLLCCFATTLFLVLSLIHWVLIGSGQISREKGKKFHVVREKIDKLFEDSRRQHGCFRISDDTVLSGGKVGSKLNHNLQVPN